MDREVLIARLLAWADTGDFGRGPSPSNLRRIAAAQLEADARRIAELSEALEPFATFADTFIDSEGWNGPMSSTRIVDWFGPSDFRTARAALGGGG